METLELPNLVVVPHPLVQHMLTLMREESCPHAEFRHLVALMTPLLVYEGSQHVSLPIGTAKIATPGTFGTELRSPVIRSDDIVLVAIMRAGMPMAAAAHHYFPRANFGHIGLKRSEGLGENQTPYLECLPELVGKSIFVFDPVIATGQAAAYVLNGLKERGADLTRTCFVSVIWAKPGAEAVAHAFPEVTFIAAACDPEWDQEFYVHPGFGDASWRLYGFTREER